MSYILKTNIANKSNYGGKRATSKIKYLVLHYTTNDGDTDESNGKYFHNNVVKASAHYFVDDDSVTQSVYDDYIAYSVGGSRYSNYKTTGGATLYGIVTNTNSVNVEMCDTIKNGKHDVSEATLENTIQLCKVLMKKHNIDINHVVRHFDVTGKGCPVYFVDNTEWTKFKVRLLNALNETEVKQVQNSNVSAYGYADFITDCKRILNLPMSASANTVLSKTVTIGENSNKFNRLVTPWERLLKSLGYYTGTIEEEVGKTPCFGGNMTKAMKKFQTYVCKQTNVKYIDGIASAKGTAWKYALRIKQ